MSEEQDIPKQPPKVEATSDPNMQDSLISSSETQPPNMEVHHHPDLHHKKKHWKEYFLEFLMIFLAVTMSFFAESLRERISDTTKEYDYIKSLISDLGDDIRVNDNAMPKLETS